MSSEMKHLLIGAMHEITSLRRENETLRAKVEVMGPVRLRSTHETGIQQPMYDA